MDEIDQVVFEGPCLECGNPSCTCLDWEPVMPSVAVATEAYQVLLELNRQHPEDEYLRERLADADSLMWAVWKEYDKAKREML